MQPEQRWGPRFQAGDVVRRVNTRFQLEGTIEQIIRSGNGIRYVLRDDRGKRHTLSEFGLEFAPTLWEK